MSRLITEWRIQKRVEEQFNAFLSGFNELIPPDLVNVFDERELELLIGGIADIDIEDWKKHTDYRGYTENDEVIQNFWKCIRSWDAEQKSRLLQFATGTSRIPVNGFKDLQGSDGPRRFTIEKAGEPQQLPKSHTWYFQLSRTIYTAVANSDIVSTVLISPHIRRSRRSTRNSPSLLRRRWALGRNRRHGNANWNRGSVQKSGEQRTPTNTCKTARRLIHTYQLACFLLAGMSRTCLVFKHVRACARGQYKGSWERIERSFIFSFKGVVL